METVVVALKQIRACKCLLCLNNQHRLVASLCLLRDPPRMCLVFHVAFPSTASWCQAAPSVILTDGGDGCIVPRQATCDAVGELCHQRHLNRGQLSLFTNPRSVHGITEVCQPPTAYMSSSLTSGKGVQARCEADGRQGRLPSNP